MEAKTSNKILNYLKNEEKKNLVMDYYGPNHNYINAFIYLRCRYDSKEMRGYLILGGESELRGRDKDYEKVPKGDDKEEHEEKRTYRVLEIRANNDFNWYSSDINSSNSKLGHCDDPLQNKCKKSNNKGLFEFAFNASGRETYKSCKELKTYKEYEKWVENCKEYISTLITSDPRTLVWTLKSYQAEIANAVYKIFKEGLTYETSDYIKALVAACCRIGKSLIGTYLWKYAIKEGLIDKNTPMVVYTPFTNAQNSFEYPAENLRILRGTKITTDKGEIIDLPDVDFTGTKFYNKDNLGEFFRNPDFTESMFFFSSQFIKTSPKYKKFNDLMIKNRIKAFLIVDETHRDSDTERSDKVICDIPHTYELHLSGTPYEDILNNRFCAEQIVNFDIYEALTWDKKHPNGDKLNFSKLHIHPISHIQEVLEGLAEEHPEWKKTMEQAGCDLMGVAFATLEDARITCGELFSTHKNGCRRTNYWFNIKKLTHILTLLPDNFKYKDDGIEITAKPYENALIALKEESKKSINDSLLSGYKVRGISPLSSEFKTKYPNWNKQDWENPKDVGYFLKDNEKIQNRFLESSDYTMIVTKNKDTTGVTLDELNTVLLFKKIGSLELLGQILFRPMTSTKNKEDAYVYSMDPEINCKAGAGFIITSGITRPNVSDVDIFTTLKGLIDMSDGLTFDDVSIYDLPLGIKSILRRHLACVSSFFGRKFVASVMNDEDKSQLKCMRISNKNRKIEYKHSNGAPSAKETRKDNPKDAPNNSENDSENTGNSEPSENEYIKRYWAIIESINKSFLCTEYTSYDEIRTTNFIYEVCERLNDYNYECYGLIKSIIENNRNNFTRWIAKVVKEDEKFELNRQCLLEQY